jgi:hypothetical protein
MMRATTTTMTMTTTATATVVPGSMSTRRVRSAVGRRRDSRRALTNANADAKPDGTTTRSRRAVRARAKEDGFFEGESANAGMDDARGGVEACADEGVKPRDAATLAPRELAQISTKATKATSGKGKGAAVTLSERVEVGFSKLPKPSPPVMGAAAASVAVVGGAAAMSAKKKKKMSNADVVLLRYAKLITEAYDIPLIPDFLEDQVYREVANTAYESAVKNLEENLASAAVLGHPVVLSNVIAAGHMPKKSGIKEKELQRFIAEVLGTNRGMPFLSAKLEQELYTNAVLTGWTVMEDTLSSFKVRLFDKEFGFVIEDEDMDETADRRAKQVSDDGGQLDIVPNLSTKTLLKIAHNELELPTTTRIFPKLEENAAKLAVGMLSEACTMEAKIKGFAVEFALEPYDEESKEAFSNISFSEKDNVETKAAVAELITVCVDDFMKSRPVAISSIFLPAKLERETYINVLKGLFGEIGGGPILNNLGFTVAMRITRQRQRPATTSATTTSTVQDLDSKLSDQPEKRKTARELFEQMADDLRRGDFGNIGSSSRELLGIRISGDEDPDTAKKKAQQKRSYEEVGEFVDYLLEDPMYNVKAIPDNIERALYINCFELLLDVMSTLLSDFELDMLGRRIRMQVRAAPKRGPKQFARFRPDSRALDEYTKEFAEIPAVREIMCNVYAFVLAFIAQVASDFEMIVVGHRFRTSLSRKADALLLAKAAAADTLDDPLVQAIEAFAQDVFAISSSAQTNRGGSAEKRDSREIDLDKQIYELFEKNATDPDDNFPFPYLNREQFTAASDAFINSIFPEAINLSSQSASVKSIAKAADLNGDGVIQWAEWYYAARAINRALVASGEESSRSIDDEK